MLALVTVLEVVRSYMHVLVLLHLELPINGTLINDRFEKCMSANGRWCELKLHSVSWGSVEDERNGFVFLIQWAHTPAKKAPNNRYEPRYIQLLLDRKGPGKGNPGQSEPLEKSVFTGELPVFLFSDQCRVFCVREQQNFFGKERKIHWMSYITMNKWKKSHVKTNGWVICVRWKQGKERKSRGC